jgi:hypothetical protein
MAYIVAYISMAVTYTFKMFRALAPDLRPMFTALAKTTAATVLCNQPRLNMLAARYFFDTLVTYRCKLFISRLQWSKVYILRV